MKIKSEDKFNIIKNYIFSFHKSSHGYLSIRKISSGTGIPFPTVQRYINDLKSSGEVIIDQITGVEIVESVKISKEFTTIGLLGSIGCSLPKEPELFFDEYYKFPSALLGSGNYFLVRATGESMINAGIKHGDLVLIKEQSTAIEGQLIIALLGQETTLKRYFPKKNKVILHPENDDRDLYPDIIISGNKLEDFHIQGIAVKVISDLT